MGALPGHNIKIFSDGADIKEMVSAYKAKSVDGFTTNPTLMRKAGVTNYEQFAKDVLKEIKDMPISFEVFSDDIPEMEREARIIASWGDNVYVKIPIMNTKGESTVPLIQKLSHEGIKLNITAILTIKQVMAVADALSPDTPSIVSVFAGRIADIGLDPIPLMKESARILSPNPNAELLWASSRELLNLMHAKASGAHIITIPPDILKKTPNIGKDLSELSLDTVKMFYNDAQSAGYKI